MRFLSRWKRAAFDAILRLAIIAKFHADGTNRTVMIPEDCGMHSSGMFSGLLLFLRCSPLFIRLQMLPYRVKSPNVLTRAMLHYVDSDLTYIRSVS